MTRAQLCLYAEDAGNALSEARHGKQWKNEVPADLAGPMARTSTGKDFFVHEIAMANVDDRGTVAPVMVTRWYEIRG